MLKPIHAGTSGFRGVTNTEITPAHALALGTLYGEFLTERLGKSPIVVVGHDQRHGATMLANAAVAGLQSVGAHVTTLGCVATPVFCTTMTKMSQADGGILITGSHMLWKRTGIILMNADGTYCDASITDPIEERLTRFPERELAHAYSPERIGRITTIDPDVSTELYVRLISVALGHGFRSVSRPRVLVDAGNGTMGTVARELLTHLGYDVSTIFFEPKPVPDRPSECRAASCTEAIRLAHEKQFDLTVCFDGDGDRGLYITSQGVAVSEDVIGALFAREILHEGDMCVTPANSSNLIKIICRLTGARLEFCKIGQPDTGRAIKQHHAAFAYENCAKYWFPKELMWYDALYATVILLRIMEQKRASLAELVASLPPFFQVECGLAIPDAKKREVVETAIALAEATFARETEERVTIDGSRRNLTDGSSLMLRASGTEPKVRVYTSAPTETRAQFLANEGVRFFTEAIAAAG